ncbi:MAG: M24 family metallopeptidase [Gaiellaceae bacterium MAG52_C11]|nr:M24 family metallopeptidase [Candidatus Gaiellasilicea maunaloa]
MSEELAEKRRRLLALIESEDLDAVVLRRPANIAWYSGGGRTHIVATTEVGVADVVVTREGHEVVTAVNEAARLRVEELGTLEARFTVLPWTDPRERSLPSGSRVGCDTPLPGTRDVGHAVVEARRALTPPEVDRYRVLGRDAAAAMTTAAFALEPGGTEFEAAALLARSLQERGIDPVVLLVAGMSRLGVHRHPLPTSAPLGRLAMLVTCARRGGLIASLTRFVSFGRLDEAVRDAHERLLHVDAAFVRATVPGRAVGEVFAAGIAAYAEHGFEAGEWRLHHQGGPTGYEPRDYLATAESTATVVEGQAFAWNPSVLGLKSEDTFVAGAAAQELVTVDGAWPAVGVDGISRPLVLER